MGASEARLHGQTCKSVNWVGAMAVDGIQQALLQVTHPGALLGQCVLTLLHHCLQGHSLLLHLCSPVPLLVHLALEALVLILSLLCSSHQSVHAHTLSGRCGHVHHHVSQRVSAMLVACTNAIATVWKKSIVSTHSSQFNQTICQT